MTAQPPIPPSTPHILRIPGEIRNQIYENLLVFSHPVRIYRESPETTPNSDTLATTLLPLFLTCHQIHLEASAVFYSQNQFAPSRRGPHQAQANQLFRVFLDRVGPRNASLLRHLALPFPVDPAELLRGHLYNSSLIGRGEGDDSGCCRSLVPRLRERCPGLETVEFDLRGDGHVLRLLRPNTATMREVLGGLEEALWAAFPRLKHVDLRLYEGAVRTRRGVDDGQGSRWEYITSSWKEDGDGFPACISRWEPTWHPANARYPGYLIVGLQRALRSEIHRSDRWGLLKDRARSAVTWLRSKRVINEWEEKREQREWERAMIAQAGPVGAPLYCFGASSVSGTPVRRESLKRGVFGFLTSRR